MRGLYSAAMCAVVASCAASAAAQVSTQTLCLASPSGYRLDVTPACTNAEMRIPVLAVAGLRAGKAAVPEPAIDYSVGGGASGSTAPSSAPRSRGQSRQNKASAPAGSEGLAGAGVPAVTAPGWGWLADGMKARQEGRAPSVKSAEGRSPFDRTFSADGPDRFDLSPSAFDNAFDRQPDAKRNPFGPRPQTGPGR